MRSFLLVTAIAGALVFSTSAFCASDDPLRTPDETELPDQPLDHSSLDREPAMASGARTTPGERRVSPEVPYRPAPTVPVGRVNNVYLGLNLLNHALTKITNNETGEPNLLGTPYFNLDAQLTIPLSLRWRLAPSVMWMPDFLLPHKSSDGGSTSSFAILAPLADYRFDRQWDLEFGPALVLYEIKGHGGVSEQSNGNTVTKFAYPGDTVISKTIALLGGFALQQNQFRFSGDLMIEGLASSQKRAWSLLLTVQYDVFHL